MSTNMHYMAVNEVGKVISGSIMVDGWEEFNLICKEKAWTAIALRPINKIETIIDRLRLDKKRFLKLFTLRMLLGLKTGKSIAEVLKNAAMSSSGHEKTVLQDLDVAVNSGKSIAQAMRLHTSIFDDYYRFAVDLGERTGSGVEVFQELDRNLKSEDKVKSHLKKFITPFMIMGFSALASIGAGIYVVGRFDTIYKTYKLDLPFTTQIMRGLGQLITSQWELILSIMFTALLSWLFIRRNEQVQYYRDLAFIKMPALGSIIVMAEISRFTNFVRICYAKGEIVGALELVEHITKNKVFAKAVKEVRREVMQGKMFSDALMENKMFKNDTIFSSMVAIGESTSNLSMTLKEVSNEYDDRIPEMVEMSLPFLRFLLTFFMACVVGFIVSAIYQPYLGIFEIFMNQSSKGF